MNPSNFSTLARAALLVSALAMRIAPSVSAAAAEAGDERLRLIIETDAGGDPDDEQSLIRFLLYANEWDVEGIIANRARARDGENLNPVRDGLGIVRRQLDAYGQVHPNLLLHDRRYPTKDALWSVTVAGYDETEDGVDLIIRAVDRDDPRPVWFLNWGTDHGAAESSLKRALDRVRARRGFVEYAAFKRKLRLSSDDQFGDHTWTIEPPFAAWTYTARPDMDGGRWYHRFSPLTATAGGFDVKRDVLEGHGPLGALYPTNTNRPQKEGDTLMFLRLVPNGLNDPDHPEWGSWAGRFGKMRAGEPFERDAGDRNYYCPNQRDTVDGKAHRDHTLSRWAAHFQNDFRARLDWCVKDRAGTNHPPTARVEGGSRRDVSAGATLELNASPSRDADDGDTLSYQWIFYPEETDYTGPALQMNSPDHVATTVSVPAEARGEDLHVILVVTDSGSPPLTRYRRVILDVTE